MCSPGVGKFGGRGPSAAILPVQEMSSEYREYADSFGKVSAAGPQGPLGVSQSLIAPLPPPTLPSGLPLGKGQLSSLPAWH